VLFCRHYYRLSRDRAILQLSRDRAQSDLQMIIHQRARAPMSDRSSFPESETVRPAIRVSAISVSGASLPPGPPSSAHSEHAASQLAAAPSTPFVAGGVPPATMGPSGPSSAPDHAISLALPNRTATIGAPVLAPPAKPRCKAAYAKTAYLEFCRVTRPLLPKSLRNAEREKVIGERWKALSAAEKAHYKVKGETPAKARPLSAAARTVAARTVAAAASGDGTDWNAKRPRTTAETHVSGTIPSAAPTSLALAAPSYPRTAPTSATRTPSVAPYPPASCSGELWGLDVVTEILEQMTEEEALEAGPAPSAAAAVAAAPPAPPTSLPALPADLAQMFDEPTTPALPADLAQMFDEPTTLAAPPAAPPAPSVALATPTVRPSFAPLAALPATPAAPNAPTSSANTRFELLVTHALEDMTEEEAAEVLLGSCLSTDDQQLLFPPGLSV